jgi:hypothetical protein
MHGKSFSLLVEIKILYYQCLTQIHWEGGSDKTNVYFWVMRYFLTVGGFLLYYHFDFHSAKTLKTRKSEPQTAWDGCEKRVYEISLT